MNSDIGDVGEEVSHKVATHNPLEQFVLLAKGKSAGCVS